MYQGLGGQSPSVGNQPDPLASQPDDAFDYGLAGTSSMMAGSEDGPSGGWDGLSLANSVESKQSKEQWWVAEQGIHTLDVGGRVKTSLQLSPDDEAELERQLGQTQPQHLSQESQLHCQQQQERQYRPSENGMPAPQVQMKPVRQPDVPGWVPQTVQHSANYAALEQKLHQMSYAHSATAQQEQQPQQSGEEPPAGCGSDHLLPSPPAPVAAISGKDFEPATVQPPAAGSRKRKALQPADSPLPPAKRATHAPAQQAAAAAVRMASARSKGSGGSSGAGDRKSVVRSTARRAIVKKSSQKRTPGQQPLQPAPLLAAAASIAASAAVQQAQQTKLGSATAAQQQQGEHPVRNQQKQKQQAANAVAGKQASTACGSEAAAGSCGTAGCSQGLVSGNKGKTAASGSSIEASSSQSHCGKRVRVSRPRTGNPTGRRKGGMNVPPEKLFAYHMDLLGKGGKQKLAEKFQTRTDSLAIKVQSFLRGLINPKGKVQLTDGTIIYQKGHSWSLDKQRLLREGITDFGKFSVKYVEPNPNAENRATIRAEGQRSNQRRRRPRQA